MPENDRSADGGKIPFIWSNDDIQD